MKNKILFVLHLPPPIHGSSVVGRQIKNSKKINSTFIADFLNISTSSEINKIGYLSFYKLFSYLKVLLLCFKKLVTHKYDLVYIAPTISGIGFYKDFLIVLVFKMFRKKLIFHLHNGLKSKDINSIDHWLYKYFFKKTEVILLSELLYQEINDYVKFERIYICPNGIEQIENSNKKNKRSENGIPVILFLANLLMTKGVLELVEACSLVKKKGFEFRCIIIGGERDFMKKDLLRMIARNNLDNEIKYLGPKFGKEKQKYFMSSDIFVLPTYYETFGIVLVEAMQYGLPVISTDVGGIPDLIEDGHNGYLVKKKDSIALANSIIKMISNRCLMEIMGREGRKRFLNSYTFSIFEEKMVEILRASLERNSRDI